MIALDFTVALLAEGVDRNSIGSAFPQLLCVALLAEGVDRNIVMPAMNEKDECRPPRGGRG